MTLCLLVMVGDWKGPGVAGKLTSSTPNTLLRVGVIWTILYQSRGRAENNEEGFPSRTFGGFQCKP
jgi:hypothetical protein